MHGNYPVMDYNLQHRVELSNMDHNPYLSQDY